MSAGRLPAPGTEYGPCETCEHLDCTATREQARTICHYCVGVIGYENRYYNDETPSGERTLVHADCLEKALEL